MKTLVALSADCKKYIALIVYDERTMEEDIKRLRENKTMDTGIILQIDWEDKSITPLK